MRHPGGKSQAGFAMISALMVVLLSLFLVMSLAAALSLQWEMASSAQAQLHSLVLAENGLEYARTILPHLEINRLLRGQDGTFTCAPGQNCRDPLSFSRALSLGPEEGPLGCDDGFPWQGIHDFRHHGYGERGRFFLRFSNNPEEAGDEDRDGIVLVRSMGVVPSPAGPHLPGVRNAVALLEASFRQERAFQLKSALTLFATRGSFLWRGVDFWLDGGAHPAVELLMPAASGLRQDLESSLLPGQSSLLVGAGGAPSIRDATVDTVSDPLRGRLMEAAFWSHLLEHLPNFNDGPSGPLFFLRQGGVLDTDFSGILVARGNLTIEGRARIRGLVLHLGRGRLTIRGRSVVEGAVWLSNLEIVAGGLTPGPLFLTVGGQARILYQVAAVREALSGLPPTQIGWRMLFPETGQ